jgi:excisionase family DNA binding protein
MEKICIVRRRKKFTHERENRFDVMTDNAIPPNQNLSVISPDTIPYARNYDVGPECSKVDSHEIITFPLTPEQSNLFQSSTFLQYVSDGIPSNGALNVEQHGDGRISLNFYFEKVHTPRLLKPMHVCQMLQISKSYLRKLVKTRSIRSYKMGRLRRFSLDDVLEYLMQNGEFGE